jgi:hypothetical protein
LYSRYQKQAAPEEEPYGKWVPGVPTVAARARSYRKKTENMVFSTERGGWVDGATKSWSNRPTAVGNSILTNWSPDVGVPNFVRARVSSNHRDAHDLRRMTASVVSRRQNVKGTSPASMAPAASYSVAPPGTFDGVSSGKYARGISRRPWSAPRWDETDVASDSVLEPTTYPVQTAAGTNVLLRGGSWPVQMTVPPDCA